MASLGELRLLWDIRSELAKMNELMEEEKLRREWEDLRRSEEELRRSEEVLNTTLRRLREELLMSMRQGERGLTRLRTIDPSRPAIYPHISAEQEADLLERGELRLDITADTRIADPNKENRKPYVYWADETREEAQHPWYIERKKFYEEYIKQAGIIHFTCPID